MRTLALLFLFTICLLESACDSSNEPAVRSAFTTNSYKYGTEATPVDTFSPKEDTIYAVMQIDNAPPNTPTRIVWTAVDVLALSGERFVNREMREDKGTVESWGTSAGIAYSRHGGTRPTGEYKVDIYLADKLAKTLVFTVK